ncbi:Transposable element Tcb1 transposase, partial [Stegodyphus mimosarum]
MAGSGSGVYLENVSCQNALCQQSSSADGELWSGSVSPGMGWDPWSPFMVSKYLLVVSVVGTIHCGVQGNENATLMAKNIVRMAVMDRSITSRTIAQPTQSVTHHPGSARTIRRRLQQSGLSPRRPLLGPPLAQNHRRLRRQWSDERIMWTAEWNEIVFTDESLFCLQHHDVRIPVWRHRGERMLNSCVLHRHTGPAPGIMVLSGIEYHSRTPLVRIASILNSQCYISEVLEPIVLPYLQGLPTAIFQKDNARPLVARIVQGFFVNRQIELLPWPARCPDLSPIEKMWSMVAERLTQITFQAATPDQLWQRVEAAWSAVPQEHIQSLLESMPISNNGGYSGS